MILSCVNIEKSFGHNEVLKDITFKIEDNEKVAIVGVNGAGKTTLFKILTKQMPYDKGDLVFSKSINSIGYLAQMLDLDDNITIYETLIEVFRPIIDLENLIHETEILMTKNNKDGIEDIMKKYSHYTKIFEEKSGYEYKSRVRGVIKGLGFSQEEQEKKIGILSGGEKTRVSLGKLLLSAPDLLLLDEPTNHLDIESIEWLEDYLKNYNKSIIIISHDRYFINKTVNKIIEIENGKSKTYNGNYSFFSSQKEIQRQIDLKHYINQQREIKKQEDVIKQLKQFNREKSIKRAESREKQLNKIDRLDKPENLPDTMRLKIVPKFQSGNDVLEIKDLAKSYGNRTLFKNVSFFIERGEKVALIGPNGIGKSTILKIILKEIKKDCGTIKIGANVGIAYYDQGQAKLDESKTIFDEIYDTYPTMTVTEIRNMLATFVFTKDDVFKKISNLSGGEKGRVALAKIMLSQGNFLILDEPTNHLDTFSKEILENALKDYEGTVLYVSHDRYFINNTATKILDLNAEGIITYDGNYDYYLEKKKEPSFVLATIDEDIQKPNKWQEDKDNKSMERKRKASIRKIEDLITNIENDISSIEDLLNKPNIVTDYLKTEELFKQKVRKEEELETLMKEWEELQE